MNKRRSTYCELSARESRAMRSMRPGRWLRPSRIVWAGVLERFSNSSPAVVTPAGAALAEPPARDAQPAQERPAAQHPFPAQSPHSSPAVITRAGAALDEPAAAHAQPTQHDEPAAAHALRAQHDEPAHDEPAHDEPAQQAEPEHDRSMVAVVVIAVAVTVLAISVLVGTEVVLRALGRTSFISEFVGSPSANPGYIYDLILIAIAVLGASLGTAFLIVSAIVGVRLERRQGIVLGSDADGPGDSGAAFGAVAASAGALGAAVSAAAAGALGAAGGSRFAPPASADPAQLFTPPDPLEAAPR